MMVVHEKNINKLKRQKTAPHISEFSQPTVLPTSYLLANIFGDNGNRIIGNVCAPHKKFKLSTGMRDPIIVAARWWFKKQQKCIQAKIIQLHVVPSLEDRTKIRN